MAVLSPSVVPVKSQLACDNFSCVLSSCKQTLYP